MAAAAGRPMSAAHSGVTMGEHSRSCAESICRAEYAYFACFGSSPVGASCLSSPHSFGSAVRSDDEPAGETAGGCSPYGPGLGAAVDPPDADDSSVFLSATAGSRSTCILSLTTAGSRSTCIGALVGCATALRETAVATMTNNRFSFMKVPFPKTGDKMQQSPYPP